MIHRYSGYYAHTPTQIVWECTCDATGAVRYDHILKAKIDYLEHQKAIVNGGGERCDYCTAVTEEPFNHPDGIAVTLCIECYELEIPAREREWSE